ncbi:hypothetical protein KZ829_22915 [Actinoplanes hulinensis]|uniref:Uncharacterized protein n=1 Tax=Actinoplanes hulinensis TaxID=1144547 RepID=A0ABS7B8I5_9ACTN|nr:hypothetical protein [Actinoplanes hulinensis]MBW6436598.1 hypothetical protein [Actinoplanes hulinensis]
MGFEGRPATRPPASPPRTAERGPGSDFDADGRYDDPVYNGSINTQAGDNGPPAAGGRLIPFETRDPTPRCADH